MHTFQAFKRNTHLYRALGITKCALACITFTLLLSLTSCSTAYKLKQADKAFSQGAYSKAIDKYRPIITAVPREQQSHVLFNLAEANRFIGNTRQAETYYERIVARPSAKPDAYLGLALVEQAQEKYDEAIVSYEKYLTMVPQDSMAKQNLEFSKELADTVNISYTRYLVENVRELNTNKDEFAPVYAEDDYSVIYFTSNRDAALGKKMNIITGEKSSDIFSMKQNHSGKWERPVPIEGVVNTKAEEGVCCFSNNFRMMYFTQCATKGSKLGCRIYTANFDEESRNWVEVNELKLTDSTNNAAHPCLSEDGTELYFVSDMPGGYGGMDIWMVTRVSDGDGWGEPENLGPTINTSGDEMYPHSRENGDLYFASNGHPGYGGLDIFKAAKKDIGGWEVTNMGLPINSAADDFSIVFEREREAGYFASRRRGGRGGDDIYRFVMPESQYIYIASVKYEDGSPVEGANVKIINSLGELKQQKSEADGVFTITLSPETDYLITITKPEYFNQKDKFSTKGLEGIITLRGEFLMRSMAQSIELENILYDFGRWELRPESEESLNGLVEILNDNPTISIEIASHSDSRGDSAVNMRISQRRAQSVVDFLIGKGISADRLKAQGYGESQPRIVTAKIAAQYKFLREGDVLNDDFMRRYVHSKEEEEIVDQLNRRTEFTVISNTEQ